MANIQTRITEDNRVMYTARIRIKGYSEQTATFSRLADAKQWARNTEATCTKITNCYFGKTRSGLPVKVFQQSLKLIVDLN